MQCPRHEPGWDCHSTHTLFIAWPQRKHHQNPEILKELCLCHRCGRKAMLHCWAAQALSETTRVREDWGRWHATNIYYMEYRSLPSPLEANTTELVSYSKWRWEPGHKISKQKHWSTALQAGTCRSAERYCTRAGLLREQGTIVPSSAHKKYYLLWSSQPQQ